MSRKRAPSAVENPRAKRHLNAALAAELQSLRISHPSGRNASPRHAFGASIAASPFLTSRESSRFAPSSMQDGSSPSRSHTSVDMRVNFADALAEDSGARGDSAAEPVILSPDSSSSSMALDDLDVRERASFADHTSGMDDITIEELDASADPENRLVVYRPPVRSSAQTMSQINARLPEGRYMLRNPKTNEWLFKEARQDRVKRKMALVPWRGNVKKMCDATYMPPVRSGVAIPMPWHDSHQAAPAQESDMDMDDIS